MNVNLTINKFKDLKDQITEARYSLNSAYHRFVNSGERLSGFSDLLRKLEDFEYRLENRINKEINNEDQDS